MTQLGKNDLVKKVNMAAREYGISTVLFRHAVGDMLGVNVTDMECLALIFFKGLATPSEISRYTGLTSGATTAMLDRLERARLIKRLPNPDDRRGTLIVLTDDRTQKLESLFATARESINRLTTNFSEGELQIIANYLTQLTMVWEDARMKLKRRFESGS